MSFALRDFIEQMGCMVERRGLPRILGRIFAHFLVHPEPQNLDELAKRLGVSKASVSTNARKLEDIGLIEIDGRPGDRRDFYRLCMAPWRKIAEMESSRLTELNRLFSTTIENLPEEDEEVKERLNNFRAFYHFMVEDMNATVERWERRQKELMSNGTNVDKTT